MANTIDMRRISHELAQAWDEVEMAEADEREGWFENTARLRNAIDAIISAYTPGYNADTPPDLPEEYDLSDPTGKAYTPEAQALWKAAGY